MEPIRRSLSKLHDKSDFKPIGLHYFHNILPFIIILFIQLRVIMDQTQTPFQELVATLNTANPTHLLELIEKIDSPSTSNPALSITKAILLIKAD